MCISTPCRTILPKLPAFHVQTKEMDPFECDISEEDMNQENNSNLIEYVINQEA